MRTRSISDTYPLGPGYKFHTLAWNQHEWGFPEIGISSKKTPGEMWYRKEIDRVLGIIRQCELTTDNLPPSTMTWHCSQHPCIHAAWAAREWALRADGTLRMSGPTGSVPKANPCSLANPWFTNPGLVWTRCHFLYLAGHASNTIMQRSQPRVSHYKWSKELLKDHVCRNTLTTASWVNPASPQQLPGGCGPACCRLVNQGSHGSCLLFSSISRELTKQRCFQMPL